MKFIVVFLSLMAMAYANGSCQTCGTPFCNSKYGSDIDKTTIVDLPEKLSMQSFQYLLTSSYFDTFKQNRPGFSKLFSKLSDDTWDETLKVIKHMYKRGLKVAVKENQSKAIVYEPINELMALSKALDMQKEKANSVFEVMKHSDHELISFFENSFVHSDADRIREISGHVNDMKRIAIENESKTLPLGIEVFDSYLQDKY